MKMSNFRKKAKEKASEYTQRHKRRENPEAGRNFSTAFLQLRSRNWWKWNQNTESRTKKQANHAAADINKEDEFVQGASSGRIRLSKSNKKPWMQPACLVMLCFARYKVTPSYPGFQVNSFGNSVNLISCKRRYKNILKTKKLEQPALW